MRVPLAFLLAPPVVLLGSVAVFAALHAWSETPRREVSLLPGAERPDRLGVDLGEPDLTPSANSTSAGQMSIQEASGPRSTEGLRQVRVRWSVDVSSLSEIDRTGLRCAIVSARRGTVLAGGTPEMAAEGLSIEAAVDEELWAVVYHEDESPRRQYRQRDVLEFEQNDGDEIVIDCALQTMSVKFLSPESGDRRGRRQVALSVTREDDERWGLAPAHEDVLEFDSSGMTQPYALRALGPGRYRVCADGIACATVDWPTEGELVIELPTP
ncbi:MAG: hypothetical protein AAF196_18280 [Planctomycetota bacterium]